MTGSKAQRALECLVCTGTPGLWGALRGQSERADVAEVTKMGKQLDVRGRTQFRAP